MAEGYRLNRADFLKMLADLTLHDYSLSDVALTRLTPDAAVLTYKVTTKYTYKGIGAKETPHVIDAHRGESWPGVSCHWPDLPAVIAPAASNVTRRS